MPHAHVPAAGGAMSAATAILEFTPTMRGLIENVIEDLLLLLDEIDGDADAEITAEDDEDGHDAERPEVPEYLEPWMGFRESSRAHR